MRLVYFSFDTWVPRVHFSVTNKLYVASTIDIKNQFNNSKIQLNKGHYFI